jgi:pimeloyl-ACP methyl ester carboxylesterase
VLTERQAQIGEVRVNYAEGPSNGRPLVVLHGGSARWQHGATLVRLLAERWHVYAPDLRGHGLSGRVPGKYALRDYADDIAGFLAEVVREPSMLFGHSLGGEIAVMVAAEHPSLVRATIVGDAPLTIESHPTEEPGHRAMIQLWRDLAGRPVAEIDAALKQMPMRMSAAGEPQRAIDVLGPASEWFPLQATSLHLLDRGMLDAVLAGPAIMLAGYDPHVLLPAIACPTLLLQADPARGGLLRDDEVALARRLNPRIGHTRLTGLGHELHGPPSQAPQVLQAMTTFLDGLDV